MPGFSLRRRLASAVGFGVLSGSPIALWFLRNHLLVGRSTGVHRLHLVTLEEVRDTLMPASRVVSTWLFPESLAGTVTWVGPAVLAGLVILAAVAWRRRSSDAGSTKRLQIRCAAVYGLVYFAFLAVCGAGLYWIPEQRHMSPMYPSFMLLIVVALEDVSRSLERLRRGLSAVGLLCVGLCLAWLLWRLPLARRDVVSYIHNGAGGYSQASWQELDLVTWLRQHPPQGKIYSNIPEAIYLLTGTIADATPSYDTDEAEFAKEIVDAHQLHCLV